jgi:ubiquitin carboxyl-terminal hydrolase 5/13
MEHKLKCSECGGVRQRVDEEESIGLPVPARPKTSAMEGVEEKHKEKAEGQGGQGQSELEAAAEAKAKDEKVEFEPVELEECLDLLTAANPTEYKCPKCDKSVVAWQYVVSALSAVGPLIDLIARRSSRFATFPDTLVVHARRFQLVNWVPQKIGQCRWIPACSQVRSR